LQQHFAGKEQAMTEPEQLVQQACASCGTINRFPRRRALDDPKCGRCGLKVFPRQPVEVSDGTWRAQVEDCPLPVLVDFWAPWCGPCRAVAPVLAEVARERGGRLKVVKVNVDDNRATAARFNVRSIPNLVLVRGPLLLDQQAGAAPKEALDVWLDRFV
jgi:thioredoxin 2